MYFIQQQIYSEPWERITEKDDNGIGQYMSFDCLIDALEYVEREYYDDPNDGVRRSWRVVDEDGRVYDYTSV